MINQQRADADDCAIDLGFLSSSSSSLEEDDPASISQDAFKCHCCYEVMVDPTTLNCGHSFCRHCLVLWLKASRRMTCPECCVIFPSFPKINISLRDLVELQFPAEVARRRQGITDDARLVSSLQAIQQQIHNNGYRAVPLPIRWHPWLGVGSFLSSILIVLTFVTVVFLAYHWSGGDSEADLLVKKPVTAWTVKEVGLWLENLGPWMSPYRDTFVKEQVNGRLLNALGEEDLSKPPYSIGNELHRRAVKKELHALQALGYKRPQTLWEYKVVNEKKSFFLLFGLTHSPRFIILYMYFFDYHDSFLPFIHICCPSQWNNRSEDDLLFRNLQEPPSQKQMLCFGVKLCLLPYQLLADFAWDWLDVHYWTSRIIILTAFLLTLQEGSFLRSHWQSITIRRIPDWMMSYIIGMGCWWFSWTLLWNVMPQFVCNCLFYWTLYCTPIISTVGLIKYVCPHIFRGP